MSSRNARSRQAEKVARHRGHAKPRSIGRTVAWMAALLVVLTAVPAAVAGFFVWRISSSFDGTSEEIVEAFPQEQSRPAEREDEAQTILLLGSDSRGDLDPDTAAEAHDGRSDVIMVVRIPADRQGIYVMSIMRDSWVEIPGFGMNKVNAAFSYGGIPLATQTIENLLGTRIDHVATIDFDGFRGLTDALGGVTVDNQVAFSAAGVDFPQGEITLNGEEALTFVRERKSFGDGDYQRARNQQAYMRGVVQELLSRETLSTPSTITNSVAEISPYLSKDEGLNTGYLISMMPGLRNVRSADVHFSTIPTVGPGWSPDGTQSIVEVDWARMEELRKAYEDDTLAELSAAQQ